MPAGGDDLDISGWLGEESTLELTPTRKQPATAGDTIAGKGGDTIAGKSLDDTGTMPATHVREEERSGKEEGKARQSRRQTPSSPCQADRRRQRRGRRQRAAALFSATKAVSPCDRPAVRAANEARKSAALLGLAFTFPGRGFPPHTAESGPKWPRPGACSLAAWRDSGPCEPSAPPRQTVPFRRTRQPARPATPVPFGS